MKCAHSPAKEARILQIKFFLKKSFYIEKHKAAQLHLFIPQLFQQGDWYCQMITFLLTFWMPHTVVLTLFESIRCLHRLRFWKVTAVFLCQI